MTLETIDADGRIGVATAAEVLGITVAGRVRRITYMAVDAFHETVLPGAYPLVHGFIALVQDVFHGTPSRSRPFAAIC